jgi:multidrug transporter EmrE-like cation transporter
MEVVPIGALYIALTVILTVYGQLAFKWRIDLVRAAGPESVIAAILKLAIDPWIISVVVATGLASITWGAALTKMELSFAYPFMALTFALVLGFSVALFGESLTAGKVIGLVLIGIGLVVTGL